MSDANLFVINGKVYTIVNENDNWVVYMDGLDIAEFPTENTAKVWVNDRARVVKLSEKTNKLIDSF